MNWKGKKKVSAGKHLNSEIYNKSSPEDHHYFLCIQFKMRQRKKKEEIKVKDGLSPNGPGEQDYKWKGKQIHHMCH